jgi:hypothetical protein
LERSDYLGKSSHKINSFARGTGEGGRRPDEGRGENFNNHAAEILSRSRKVRTQIPNKTNFVTARDDGAKGQRTTQGRAGAGLAGPAGTGAGAASDCNGATIQD